MDNPDDLDDMADNSPSEPGLLTTTFELNDTLYAEAQLEDTDVVYLWLGVSVTGLKTKLICLDLM